MYEVLIDILDAIRAQGELDAIELGQILNRHNKRAATRERAYSKKRVLPYYFKLKEEDPVAWQALDIDDELERQLFATLRMKPRRTASGEMCIRDRTWTANSATQMTLTLAGEGDAIFTLAEGKLTSDDGETTMIFAKADQAS